MIENGADINHRSDCSGNSPLHIAVFHTRVPVVELLINAGAFVNATTNDWNTPLHFIGMSESFTAGLTRDGRYWNMENYDDDSYNIAELLMKNGADLNAKNVNGETPLGLVANEKSKNQNL